MATAMMRNIKVTQTAYCKRERRKASIGRVLKELDRTKKQRGPITPASVVNSRRGALCIACSKYLLNVLHCDDPGPRECRTQLIYRFRRCAVAALWPYFHLTSALGTA
jgi:hypothetical protein